MQDIKVKDLLEACGGTLLCGDPGTPVTGIGWDSRKMQDGDLFVPLKGEKADGHRFIAQALANGAAATLTGEHKTEDAAVWADGKNAGKAWIAVPDTRKALQDIGRYYRGRLTLPLIGITGSVGKTTTKEMVAAALSAGLRVYKTTGNLNSQIGVPATISGISREDQIGVIELGMSEPGELTVIAQMARVDMAVITNIGVAHMEQLGSQENIFHEKMTIQDGLKDGGILLLNGDDPWLKNAKAREGFETVYYGTGENCGYRAEEIRLENGFPTFTAVCRRNPQAEARRIPVRLRVMGAHQILNAMAALAAADLFGVPLEDAARSLGEFAGMKGRQQLHYLDGITLIDDTYNANPVSMKGAIDILDSVKDCSRRIAVLADMKELGEESARFHREVGRYLARKEIGLLVTYGALAKELGEAAAAENPGLRTVHFGEAEKDAMEKWIVSELRKGDCILLKGSNSMNLGEAADYVCQYHH